MWCVADYFVYFGAKMGKSGQTYPKAEQNTETNTKKDGSWLKYTIYMDSTMLVHILRGGNYGSNDLFVVYDDFRG